MGEGDPRREGAQRGLRFFPDHEVLSGRHGVQIVGRESGWLELQDPVTQERGFVFEKYLAAIDGPSPTQPMSASKSRAQASPRWSPKRRQRGANAAPGD